MTSNTDRTQELQDDILGVELECESCGTILSVFDDECGASTYFSTDGYYSDIRDQINERLANDT